MAQWTKVSATKPDNLFSVPRTHMVERIDCPKLSFDLHMPLPPSQIKQEGNGIEGDISTLLPGLHKCIGERTHPYTPMHTRTEDDFICKVSHLSKSSLPSRETHGNPSTVVISSAGMTSPYVSSFALIFSKKDATESVWV